jgi:hypothetical protein
MYRPQNPSRLRRRLQDPRFDALEAEVRWLCQAVSSLGVGPGAAAAGAAQKPKREAQA